MSWDIYDWLGFPDPSRPWWFGWVVFGFTAFSGLSMCVLYACILRWTKRRESRCDYSDPRWWP
jgi:hypothetical protein